MKVAIPTHDGWVSPVFDVARHLLVVDFSGGAESARQELTLPEASPADKARFVADQGTEALICAAVSAPLEEMLTAAGVRVFAQTCGPAEEVLRAFAGGRLSEGAFLMPGCCRRRRFRGGPGGRGTRRQGATK